MRSTPSIPQEVEAAPPRMAVAGENRRVAANARPDATARRRRAVMVGRALHRRRLLASVDEEPLHVFRILDRVVKVSKIVLCVVHGTLAQVWNRVWQCQHAVSLRTERRQRR